MAEYIDVKNVKSLIEVAIEDSWELDYTLDRLEQIKTSDVIERSKVKKAREEIENINPLDFLEITKQIGSNGKEMEISKKFATAILDKLIAESEGK